MLNQKMSSCFEEHEWCARAMRYYIALVYNEMDASYGLRFPDLPGCYAAVGIWDEIPVAAAEAIDLWFSRNPEVDPEPLEAIRLRPDVVEAISEGAVLFPVPYIPADNTLESVSISIERGLLRAIEETAKARRMTRSAFLASSARRELLGI
jgi:predicted RNase H-like HicB family nuclease